MTGRVVRGYGVIQPRIGTEPRAPGGRAIRALMAGQAGIDPYTTAVSDVYQDLFGEGSYVGKAIYDVDAFSTALDGRVPENRLLSHDLFEGVHARTALATDIELLDDQPSVLRRRRRPAAPLGPRRLAARRLALADGCRCAAEASGRNDLSVVGGGRSSTISAAAWWRPRSWRSFAWRG